MDDRNDRHGLPLPSEDTGDLQDPPRGGDTDDYLVAREEGVPYVPPSERVMSEPRIGEGGPDFAGAARADGMQLRQSDTGGDLAARALEALRRSDVVAGNRLTVSAAGSTVIVSGEVEAIEVLDEVMGILGDVEGVEVVEDRTTIGARMREQPAPSRS